MIGGQYTINDLARMESMNGPMDVAKDAEYVSSNFNQQPAKNNDYRKINCSRFKLWAFKKVLTPRPTCEKPNSKVFTLVAMIEGYGEGKITQTAGSRTAVVLSHLCWRSFL